MPGPEGAPIITLDVPVVGGSTVRATAGTAGLEQTELDRMDRFAQMRAGELGSVHSWELVTAVDGPGTRLTTFLSGCPLRCLYCHNPDTQTMRLGERTTVRRVVEEAGRYRAFITRGGGGLTVTGGEPLLQAAFVEDLFVGVKEAYGLHTALDTSANGGHRASDRLLANTNLVLLDIKAGNAALYERVSGGGQLSAVIEFGTRLLEHRIPVWIRFVLVPGLTDAPESIAEVADLAAELRPIVERVEVLPYHRLGVDKYAALGRAYPLLGTPPPTQEQVELALSIFRDRGLHALA